LRFFSSIIFLKRFFSGITKWKWQSESIMELSLFGKYPENAFGKMG